MSAGLSSQKLIKAPAGKTHNGRHPVAQWHDNASPFTGYNSINDNNKGRKKRSSTKRVVFMHIVRTNVPLDAKFPAEKSAVCAWGMKKSDATIVNDSELIYGSMCIISGFFLDRLTYGKSNFNQSNTNTQRQKCVLGNRVQYGTKIIFFSKRRFYLRLTYDRSNGRQRGEQPKIINFVKTKKKPNENKSNEF